MPLNALKSKDVTPAERPMLGRHSFPLKIGIVGLPNVGKSTLFNTLTTLAIPAENFPFCTVEPNKARVNVSDERLERHCKVSAFLEIHDIAGLVKGAHQGQGLGNNFLSDIRTVDGIFHVLRAFEDSDIIHVDESVDPVRDLEVITEELRLKDIEFIRKKAEDIEKIMKMSNNKQLKVEHELCHKVKAWLEDGKDVRLGGWQAADIELLNAFQLLTAKPVVYLVNMNERDYQRKKNKFLPKIHAWVKEHGDEPIISFSGCLERNLADMSPAEAAKYCVDNKVRSALTKIIKTGFSAAGPDEVMKYEDSMGVELENTIVDDDVNYTDTELVYHVRQALESVQKGDSDSYNQLVGVMHRSGRLAPDEMALLETSLKALSGVVTCIDINYHGSLLSSIFGMSFWNYAPHVMDALVDLIVLLAVSSGKYLDSCLDMLVRNFMPPPYFLDKITRPRVLTQKQEVLFRIHEALQKISYLVPLTPSRLLPIIAQRMPTIHKKDHMVVLYLENLLKLESNNIGEAIGTMILMVVMERLRDLDVEIGWDEIAHDDSTKGIFEMELEEIDDTMGVTNEYEELKEFSNQKSLNGSIIADLLDNLMVLTFEHLEGCQNAGRLVEVFEALFKSFEYLVLNTYKSKFVQFIMFYACALDSADSGVRFPSKLAEIYVSGDKPPITRMSAVAYLASYLARGKFLPVSIVVNMLKRLVDWCGKYCQIHDGDTNIGSHKVFYSGCQAVMYILCFRMKSIMDVPRLKSQLLTMPLEAVLKNKLNPLMVCLPSVVAEFLRQAKAAHLYTLLEDFVSDDVLESEFSRAFGGRERLDMFFPFDPCLLKKCDNFIRPNFLYWSIVKTTYGDDGENRSSEDEEGVEVFVHSEEILMDEEVAAGRQEQEIDIDNSLDKMSITPRCSFKDTYGGGQGKPTRMPSKIRPSMSPESL